jgi:hypothetical protein
MKNAGLAAILALMPLHAAGQDFADGCKDVAASMQDFAGFGRIELAQADTTSLSDDWCHVSAALILGNDVRFEEASFRIDQLATASPESRSLEIRLTGLQSEIGPLDVKAAISHDAETGVLELHELSARGPDGRGLSATALLAFEGILDAKAIQAALPDLGLSNLDAKVFVTPEMLSALDINFRSLTRTAMNNALKDVSETQLNSKSRRAFLGFVGAAPNAWGTLDIGLLAPSSVGTLQLASPFLTLGHTPEAAAITQALDVALTDIVLDVSWKPGRM